MRPTRPGYLCLAIVLSACGDALSPDSGVPPVLPATESMSVDLDFFGTSPASVSMGPSQTGPEGYWLAAALSVTAANVSVAIHSLVPRAIWASALSQTPSFEDGRWHWRFNASDAQNTFQSHVIGYEDGGDRMFEVRVSSSALQLDDYLLFTGSAPIGGTTGEWLFHDLNDSGAVARVAWGHPENDEWLLTFTALAGVGVGDVLAYHVDAATRQVSFADASAGTEVEVEWDAITNAGYIIAPNINGGLMACWDTELHNTTCS